MIYSSVNEKGILKADWMIKNPIGTRVASRREIKPTDKCLYCPKDWDMHSITHPRPLRYYKKLDSMFKAATDADDASRISDEVLECKNFFPAKFAIGLKKCIQKKRTGSALCADCGKEKKDFPHGNGGIDSQHLCHNEKTGELNGVQFRPALYKIIGGMWHKDWLKSTGYCSEEIFTKNLLDFQLDDEWDAILCNEAKLEGFETVKGWLDYYPKHGIDINKCWRVLKERIQ